MRRTPFLRPRSPLSTRLRILRRKSVPTSRKSRAGSGFGGSCFPKDTMALIKTGQDNETPLRIVETVVAVNDQRKRAMARKVANAFGGNLRGKSIAVLGV